MADLSAAVRPRIRPIAARAIVTVIAISPAVVARSGEDVVAKHRVALAANALAPFRER
jgi:hypothetical protein